MTREEMLKNYILSEYKSIRDFAMKTDIPYSTIDNILKRGIMRASVSSVFRICDRLGIEVEALVNCQIKQKGLRIEDISIKDRELLNAYHNDKSAQVYVDKLLGLYSGGATVGDDIKSTVSAALEKSYVKK